MKQFFCRTLAFAVMAISASTSIAATTTLSTTLPTPNIYYTGLYPGTAPNYLISNLTFTAGLAGVGGDILTDLLPYFYITASDTFSYNGKTCTGGRASRCFPAILNGGNTDSALNTPNVFQPGDQLDANYHFSLYQAQKLSLTVTTLNGLGPYTLQLWDSFNNLVTPDNAGIYALSGSSYNLELKATFDSVANRASIIGAPVTVPVPAAAWLLGSGLLGLLGAARRKAA